MHFSVFQLNLSKAVKNFSSILPFKNTLKEISVSSRGEFRKALFLFKCLKEGKLTDFLLFIIKDSIKQFSKTVCIKQKIGM